jgi:hypothetical protein
VANKDTKEAKQAKKEAERLAKEEAKKKAEEEKGLREAEAWAEKEAEKSAKEQAKREAEEAKQAKKEAERLAKEEAKKKAEEEKGLREAEARAGKEAKQAKQAKGEPAPDISSATYEGNFQLVLPSSVGFKHVKLFTQRLAVREDVEVVWTGGSLDEGTLITVSVAQATPLAQIISEMSMVGGVEVKGNKITVTLKDSV